MSSSHIKSSSKKRYSPLFADNDDYEYDSSPPTSPVGLSAGELLPNFLLPITNTLLARTHIRKGPAPERIEDADGTRIVVCKGKAPVAAPAMPDVPAASGTAAGLVVADNDPNLSSLSPPLPNRLVEPFPLAWHDGFHVVTAGSKVGVTPHWFVVLSSSLVFWLLTT